MVRGYDRAGGTLINPFQNESFKHASERLTIICIQSGSKRVGKSFAKRIKVTKELLAQL